MNWLKRCVGLLLLVLEILPGQAQQYPVQMYTNHDGLSQMQVISVFSDSRGIVWAGTKWGVSRYNGERFETLSPRQLHGNQFSAITEDRAGNVWFVQDFSHGAIRYNGRRTKLFPQLVFPLHFDHKNRGWTIGADRRLACLQGDSLHRAEAVLPQLKQDSIADLYYDEQRRQLVICTVHGYGYRYGNNKLERFVIEERLSGLNEDELGLHINTAPNQFVISGYNPRQPTLYQYAWYDGQTFVPFLTYDTKRRKMSIIRSLPQDYILTIRGKMYRVEKQSRRPVFVVAAISTARAYATIGDNLFVGTEQGLCRLTDTGFRHFDRKQAPYVWSVAEDRNGQLWWMNYRLPINVWNGQTVRTRTDHGQVNNEWYFGSRRGSDGNLYLAHATGVVRYDGKRFTLIRPPNPTEWAVTWSTLEDTKRGLLLQGTDKGVNVYRQGEWTRKITAEHDGLPDLRSYYTLAQDSQGSYWMGGVQGFCAYNPDSRQVKAYTYANKRFPRSSVKGLAFDRAGTLWIASGQGLAYLDKRTDSVRFIRTDLFNSPIYYFGIADNYLMAGDLNSLYIMDLAAFHRQGKVIIKGFNQHNGFLGIEPGQNGFYRDSKDRVWIPSGSVLSYVDMRKLRLTSDPLRANLYAVDDSLLPFSYPLDTVVQLPFNQQTIKLNCEAIGFDRTSHTQYRYKLDEKPWSGWLTTSEIYLTDLANGLHTVQLDAQRNSIDSHPRTPASIRFRVSLPFWRWGSFYYIGLFIVASGLAGIVLLTYRNRQTKLRLQEQDQQMLFLQVQTLQAQLNPHFVFNVLGTLQDMILRDDRNEANLNLIRLSTLIRSFLESSIQSELPTKRRSIDFELPLANELELVKLYVELESLQYRDRFTYSILVSPDIDPELWSIPPMLIQPFVENAIKHGLLYRQTPGSLTIRVLKGADDALLLDVEDNGVGRAEAKRRQMTSIRPYVSRGSELVERRIEVLNTLGYTIHLSITDPPAGGTLVRLSINTNDH